MLPLFLTQAGWEVVTLLTRVSAGITSYCSKSVKNKCLKTSKVSQIEKSTFPKISKLIEMKFKKTSDRSGLHFLVSLRHCESAFPPMLSLGSLAAQWVCLSGE